MGLVDHHVVGDGSSEAGVPQISCASCYQRREPWQQQPTPLFSDAGVPMMTGTDGSGQAPGQSLAQEFDELAQAGLSPLKILQMTTRYPVIFLGRTAHMGSVVAGGDANLVLLDTDPISDAQNMYRIVGVVRAGIYHSRQDLDALAARVAAGHDCEHN
jgi:imidazolonepropionase-like amidohydrolase